LSNRSGMFELQFKLFVEDGVYGQRMRRKGTRPEQAERG
jgi:hypothetical protein